MTKPILITKDGVTRPTTKEEMNEFRGQAEVNYGDGNFFVVACLRERPMLKVAGRMETLKKAIDRCLELGADYDTEIRYGTEQHNKEVFLVMPGDTVNDAVYADARKNGWLSQCHTPYCGKHGTHLVDSNSYNDTPPGCFVLCDEHAAAL